MLPVCRLAAYSRLRRDSMACSRRPDIGLQAEQAYLPPSDHLTKGLM